MKLKKKKKAINNQLTPDKLHSKHSLHVQGHDGTAKCTDDQSEIRGHRNLFRGQRGPGRGHPGRAVKGDKDQ